MRLISWTIIMFRTKTQSPLLDSVASLKNQSAWPQLTNVQNRDFSHSWISE